MRQPIIVLPLLLVCLSVFAAGCPSMEMARPILVEPDVFGFETQWWDKNVVQVQILARDTTSDRQTAIPLAWIGPCGNIDAKDSPPFTTHWVARAVTPISARDFRLIPGQVPEGFQQTVPSGTETFTPVDGETYYILVCLEPASENFGSLAAVWRPGQMSEVPRVQTIHVEGPFTHEASGMVFPVEIGRFKRTGVDRYDAEGIDVSAGYNLSSILNPMIATIYVYPISAEQTSRRANGQVDQAQSLQAHYKQIKHEIQKAHTGAKTVSERDISHGGSGREHSGKELVLEFEGPWGPSTLPLRSYLYLFGPVADRWIIKYRFTHPQRVDGTEEVEEFLREYVWTVQEP